VAVLPQPLIDSLKDVAGFDEAKFKEVHYSGQQVTSIRINPAKWSIKNDRDSISNGKGPVESPTHHSPFIIHHSVPWSQYGFYLTQRPSFTFDPLFHAGCYYVQEASSMFLEQALLQTTDLSQPLNVLDLCAAPGGKTTHLQSLLSAGSLLVSNDVIRSRTAVLKQNCIKWGSNNIVVTNNDPQHFSRLESFFDVIVVDAPCSGSGLFRRDAEAVREWSIDAVQLCCGRQKRIIADVLPALKEGGILIYSTCSYSKEEDEDVADWLIDGLGMESMKLDIKEEWGIVETTSEKQGANNYRFFPYKVMGEGFYLAVFRKTDPAPEPRLKEAPLERATALEKSVVQNWLNDDSLELFRFSHLYGLPKNLVPRYAVVKKHLNVQYAGVAIGEVLKNKLVPEHAFALSTSIASSLPVVSVDYDTAIRYLQRNDINIKPEALGWQLVACHGYNIGWINSLPNRINNYYPKEWRILKQHDGDRFEK
jgi:16S rRNA C967 or C1407 C5-methylase (RsmB/RsmF family)/NOL1/NOP2/fmu family ribosome biogenesis protein